MDRLYHSEIHLAGRNVQERSKPGGRNLRINIDELTEAELIDVNDEEGGVEVLGFVMKPEAKEWLGEHGAPEETYDDRSNK